MLSSWSHKRSDTTCAPRLDRPTEEKHQAITLKTLLNTLQDTKNIVRAKYLKKQVAKSTPFAITTQ